ncbi:LOW QUALITY PROTEIN: putative peptidase [Vibrio sp. JCM 18905]|nr:LOW QUALITY PROTEIN: putative peptidase [Vibrio sp. JCM 18905]
MHTRKLILAATFGLLLAGCSQTSTTTNTEVIPPEYPVDYFFKNSEVSSYQISPAGGYISMMKHGKTVRTSLFIPQITPPDQIKRVTSVTGRDIAYYYWVGEDTVIYSRDTGGDENFYLVTVNVKTGEEKTITPTSGVVAYVIDTLDNQPDDILISSNERNPQVFDVYRHNLKTGENTLVAQNPGNVRSWGGTDHDGNIRVITTSDGVNTSVLYRDTVEDEFKPLKNLTFKESFSPISFTPDNKNLYVASRITRDKSAIVEYDVKANKEIREIFSHPEVDVNSAHYSEALNKLVSVSYVTDKNHYHFLDDSYQQTFERLSDKLPNVEISVTSATRDESKMIVVTYSDVDRPNYYFYDRKADKLEKLAENAPCHKPEHMAKMTPIQYTARDGETIHGYLTLPKGREAKDLPLLVLPHGGPWARDHWGFQPEVQLFANRGIAVLQMNFRASTGYGREFWEKSFKQWGQSMQDDITDGVKWATEQGYAQDGNVCIYGASYGGYATLAGGVTFTPDLYKCGIDYVGVSNLFTFMDSIPPYWAPFLAMLHEQVGNPNDPEDAKMMKAYSPVFHVDQIKAPLLVLQGAQDPRVVKSESDQIVSALRERGVEVEYIVKENEGHGFRSLENRLDGYQAMDRFLKTHLLEQTQ